MGGGREGAEFNFVWRWEGRPRAFQAGGWGGVSGDIGAIKDFCEAEWKEIGSHVRAGQGGGEMGFEAAYGAVSNRRRVGARDGAETELPKAQMRRVFVFFARRPEGKTQRGGGGPGRRLGGGKRAWRRRG